jgi:hypothetical protein
MSATDHPTAHTSDRIELVPNDEQGTVTFVADLDEDDTTPPTEWITVASEDTVDLEQHR